MILSVKDRLLIPSLFEQESTMLVIAVQKDIRKKVELTAGEREKIKMKPLDNGGVAWDDKLDHLASLEVEFSEAELNHLALRAKSMDSERRVNEDNYDIVKRFSLVGKEEKKKDDE